MRRKFISKVVVVTLSTITVLSPVGTGTVCMPISTMAEEASSAAGDFEIDNGVLKKYNGTSETVVIPDGVKKIDRNAFSGNDTMTNVVFPKGLEYIEEAAFQNCTKLKSIELPASLKAIYDAAFSSCTNLEKVSLPDGLITLPSAIFTDCTSLTEITLPKNLTYIGSLSFAGCTNLSTIVFPDTSLSVGMDVFKNTKWLTDKKKENPLVIYKNIVIDGSTCTGTVTVPEGVTRIAGKAFAGAEGLTQIILPDSLQAIDGYAFENCVSLANIRIPDNVTYLGERLWYGCTNLINIAVPKSVTEIDKTAFWYGSKQLTEFFYRAVPNSSWIIYVEKGSEAEKFIKEINADLEKAYTDDKLKDAISKYKLELKDILEYEEAAKNTGVKPTPPSVTATPEINPTETPTAIPATEEPEVTPTAVPSTGEPQVTTTAVPSTEEPQVTSTAVLVTEEATPTAVVATQEPTGTPIADLPTAEPTAAPTKSPKITVDKAKINKVTKKSNTKMSITIKKITAVKGYEIVVATDRNFKKNVKKATTKKNTYLLKNLKKKKTYYIKVRAYKLNNTSKKIYGKYSDIKKVKWK